MTSTVKKIQDVTVIAPEGELDTHNCVELKESLNRELDEGRKKILVDLSGVNYMDSAALGVLVAGLKRAREKGAQFKLVGVKGPVARIFELTRLNKFFEIYDDLTQAVAQFR